MIIIEADDIAPDLTVFDFVVVYLAFGFYSYKHVQIFSEKSLLGIGLCRFSCVRNVRI